jgi:hypothetical protein
MEHKSTGVSYERLMLLAKRRSRPILVAEVQFNPNKVS